MILDLLGIDIMSYGTPTWVHWGCWSPEPEQRSDQFAILMYGSEVPLTPEEDLGLLDLLGGVDRACAAENAAESA
ncbi:MAG: hypothetical protein M5U14_04590 [Acidimicrobiia bacterium]|nr:hypothetical protein [Acidimicrobiia bacterium]